jgi:phosphomevalonate kinase
MITGFNEKNIALIQKQIRLNRQLLKDFATLNHIAIEIPRLTKLINIAEQFNGAAKTSGAGNGDCGIVIADEQTDIEEMKNIWRENGIMPLNFLVHSIA